MYPLAVAVAAEGALGCYYSGYPQWKLPRTEGLPVRANSFRTNVVYALIKYVPERFRPSSRTLFLWQDKSFDRWAGAHLAECDFVHGMPGQCLHLFRAAKRAGIRTILNHATGPVREWVRIMDPEYARVGLRLTDVCPYDPDYFAREDEEYALSDLHCAASAIVREQLIKTGIDGSRIWVVPYGADKRIFHPNGTRSPNEFRIVFAGNVGLRKGIKTLLEALVISDEPSWRMEFCGAVLGEAGADLNAYSGRTPLQFRGAISQPNLAKTFRSASVLVLPSLEEGFGLVVPQALNCGLPVIASDRVGGADLLRHRDNGSIFPSGDAAALAAELKWWSLNPRRTAEAHCWSEPARELVRLSKMAIS